MGGILAILYIEYNGYCLINKGWGQLNHYEKVGILEYANVPHHTCVGLDISTFIGFQLLIEKRCEHGMTIQNLNKTNCPRNCRRWTKRRY